MELMEINEKYQNEIHKAREALDQITDDMDEARAKELEEQYDKHMAEADRFEKKAEQVRKLEEHENRMNKSEQPEPSKQESNRESAAESEKREYRQIYDDFLRGGLRALKEEEVREIRAQSTTTTEGGYTVPEEFMAELVKSLADYGPMLDPGVTRQIATSTGADIDWPTMDDTSNKGAILGEGSDDSTDDVTFGQKTIKAYKYTSGIFQISEELLQDSALNIEQIVRDAMAERIGRIVNEHLTTGDGSSKPTGIVEDASTGVTASATDDIDEDEIINLVHEVDPAYRRGNQVAFMFNDTTLKLLRKIKDDDGRYLWQAPDMRTKEPGRLLDFPYHINQDMDDPDTASNEPIIFGAMDRFVVRRVREFAVKRLVERYAEYYQVGFVGFGRFDGKLLDTSAVKKLVMAAS